MRTFLLAFILFVKLTSFSFATEYQRGLPLYYWNDISNFGDYLSLKLVERITGGAVRECDSWLCKEQKFLAIGSILINARNRDVVWGTGMNAKRTDPKLFKIKNLDIRAVRGPLTRDFIIKNFHVDCPEVYGDPGLLMPYFFPEFKRKENPKYEYIIIPHYSEEHLFPKGIIPNVVYPTDPWREIIRKILDSKLVIASSLHGLVVADAYGIPAQYIRVTEHEPLFKYFDYYLGTNRPNFKIATSIEEALSLGGEEPHACDLKKLYYSFPFEYWPDANFKHPHFDE